MAKLPGALFHVWSTVKQVADQGLRGFQGGGQDSAKHGASGQGGKGGRRLEPGERERCDSWRQPGTKHVRGCVCPPPPPICLSFSGKGGGGGTCVPPKMAQWKEAFVSFMFQCF